MKILMAFVAYFDRIIEKSVIIITSRLQVKGDYNMEYKKLVKKIREKLIITQAELADFLGVSFASINRWETGKHEPTTKIKRKIIELCIANSIDLEEEK